ncbi:MAG: hypothetical protein ACLU6W_12980 [Lachnospiraceae bacterium]
MVKLSVISQREVEDTLQDFEKRRYLILSALRAQKNLSTAAFFTKRERSSKVSSTSLWRPVHRLFIHAFVLVWPPHFSHKKSPPPVFAAEAGIFMDQEVKLFTEISL